MVVVVSLACHTTRDGDGRPGFQVACLASPRFASLLPLGRHVCTVESKMRHETWSRVEPRAVRLSPRVLRPHSAHFPGDVGVYVINCRAAVLTCNRIVSRLLAHATESTNSVLSSLFPHQPVQPVVCTGPHRTHSHWNLEPGTLPLPLPLQLQLQFFIFLILLSPASSSQVQSSSPTGPCQDLWGCIGPWSHGSLLEKGKSRDWLVPCSLQTTRRANFSMSLVAI